MMVMGCYEGSMRRARKNHVQQELVYWGGKRKGAGRPKQGFRASQPHKARKEIKAAHPMHVTLRIEEDIGTLRRRHLYHACRKALKTVLGRDAFRIVDISLQDGHLHLTAEADTKLSLARGMQAFEIAAARYINQAVSKQRGRRRRGRVFVDRYHYRALTSPLAARHARAYVLNNWRKHHQDHDIDSMFWTVDPFSSGVSFAGWKEGHGVTWRGELDEDLEPLPVSSPQTWLLAVGWQKHGLISTHEVPGAKAARLVA
jgi:REP element-mobilizing transposase RayT